MKRFVRVLISTTGLVSWAGVASMPFSAIAQEDTCFMVNSNGSTIDLGHLCGNSQPLKRVFTAPIKRRQGGTPVIDVTFNGFQRFEMIVDTGASSTMITRSMASALGVLPVKTIKANTASAMGVEFPVGYVQSIAVDGAVTNKVLVMIAGADQDIGLLGHDFFGDYDVTLKQNVVEFRLR
ncbi:MAG: retropepsin-like aspartic protease [Cyanobacteriota bacterium]